MGKVAKVAWVQPCHFSAVLSSVRWLLQQAVTGCEGGQEDPGCAHGRPQAMALCRYAVLPIHVLFSCTLVVAPLHLASASPWSYAIHSSPSCCIC